MYDFLSHICKEELLGSTTLGDTKRIVCHKLSKSHPTYHEIQSSNLFQKESSSFFFLNYFLLKGLVRLTRDAINWVQFQNYTSLIFVRKVNIEVLLYSFLFSY